MDMTNKQRTALLACYVLATAFLLFLVPIIWEFVSRDMGENPVSGILLGISTGFAIAQLNLICVWAVLGPNRLVERLPWSLVLLTLMWFALILGNHIHNKAESAAELLGPMLLCGFSVIQIPLWVMSRLTGWRMAKTRSCNNESGHQFNIRDMLFATTVIAAVVGLGKAIVPTSLDFRAVFQIRELHMIVFALLVCNLALVVPCIWASCLSRQYFIVAAVVWLIFIVLATWIEIAVLLNFMGAPPGTAQFLFVISVFGFINFGQCATVILSMQILGKLGLHLVRQPRRPSTENTTPFAIDA